MLPFCPSAATDQPRFGTCTLPLRKTGAWTLANDAPVQDRGCAWAYSETGRQTPPGRPPPPDKCESRTGSGVFQLFGVLIN
jgi:hypothetical protein